MRFLCTVFDIVYNHFVFKKQHVGFPKSLNIMGRIALFSSGKINIGTNVKICSGFRYAVLGGYHKTRIFSCSGAEIVIGDSTGISNSIIYARNCVYIGEHVNIGAGCLITDSDHHSLNYYERCILPVDYDVKSKPILIDDGAFIGANSIILKGVHIGKRSVIGAGSVVTKDVPDDEIWAGNPAVFIKKIENFTNF